MGVVGVRLEGGGEEGNRGKGFRDGEGIFGGKCSGILDPVCGTFVERKERKGPIVDNDVAGAKVYNTNA